MFIDACKDSWLGALQARVDTLPAQQNLYLLIDGAFVPGLYKDAEPESVALLFATLPGSNAATCDVSPFLLCCEGSAQRRLALLQRCQGWPMVSLIQTPESISALAARLATWCIIAADEQRFNFRFADTRRLPGIYRALSAPQRGAFAGPALDWSYTTRDGNWAALPVDGHAAAVAANPGLDPQQFAALVDDSRADELLSLLRDRGHDVYLHPARSHALVMLALRLAAMATLDDAHTTDWSEWVWQQDRLFDDVEAVAALSAWQQART